VLPTATTTENNNSINFNSNIDNINEKGVHCNNKNNIMRNIKQKGTLNNNRRKSKPFTITMDLFFICKLVSISSMFCKQLLHAQIPKVQKKTFNLTVFFALSRSARIRAARRMLMKLTP